MKPETEPIQHLRNCIAAEMFSLRGLLHGLNLSRSVLSEDYMPLEVRFRTLMDKCKELGAIRLVVSRGEEYLVGAGWCFGSGISASSKDVLEAARKLKGEEDGGEQVQ